MLNTALKEKQAAAPKGSKMKLDSKHSLMDLCAAMASVASPDVASRLLQLGTSDLLMDNKDATLQKKNYKMLHQLCDNAAGKALITKQLAAFTENLAGKSAAVSSAAKKVTPAL